MARKYPSRFPRIPYGMIRMVVSNNHVGVSTETIVNDMRRRMEGRDLTQREQMEIVRYALAVHRENRDLYASVISGRF